MIVGAHSILYSADPAADRAFFRDVLEFPNVDVGGGWLVFTMPPSEAAFHPAKVSGKQEFYLICEDVEVFVQKMNELSVPCTPVHKEPWGLLVDITLPGGGTLGVYQALHARPPVE